VRNSVDIEIGGQKNSLELRPGEERALPLAFDARHPAALINIYSRAGFRPSQVDAASTDTRYLGVWIEFR